MAGTSEWRDGIPLSEMNTTPLIDVLLVLLIMFIITIPMQTHAVKLDLPSGPVPLGPDPVKNKVTVTADGRILWNGQPVSRPGLAVELALTRRMSPEPELQLQPEPEARYQLVDEVLATTKQAGVTRMGFVGNERYSRY